MPLQRREGLAPLFAKYLTHREDPEIRTLFSQFADKFGKDARWRLLYRN
ncbi:MAG TPA: hypothetical protein VKC60_02250 [Opitutaceae bacterium]|nr:hypothetical protein [Opitutaceae bacterium]